MASEVMVAGINFAPVAGTIRREKRGLGFAGLEIFARSAKVF